MEAVLPKGASLANYAWAMFAVVMSTLVCMSTRAFLEIGEQAMVFLLGVVLVSSRVSRGPALFAAAFSIAALDFFFVPPFFELSLPEPRHLVTFGVILVLAAFVSGLTVRIREQVALADDRERRKAALYAMSRELVMTSHVESLGEIAMRHAHELLGIDVAILLFRPGGERVCLASTDPTGALAAAAIAGEPGVLNVPMIGSRGSVGALATRERTVEQAAQMRTLETMVAQTALAIERAQLASEAENARVNAESERTRNTLLAGLSHDLRTPLLAIGGSAGVLLDSEAALDGDQRRALLTTVRDEAQKLTRLVTGLLDLVSIESGTVRAIKEWCPLEEILSSAIGRLDRVLEGRQVKTTLGGASELLMVAADPVLLEQVFLNLLDNAAKYTPPGSTIEIRAETEQDMLRIDVADQGRGISPGDEKRVFEKFYRSEKSSRACPGAGLGLALCEAIVNAHGGRIEARRTAEVGATFSVYLPLDAPAPAANKLAEGVAP